MAAIFDSTPCKGSAAKCAEQTKKYNRKMPAFTDENAPLNRDAARLFKGRDCKTMIKDFFKGNPDTMFRSIGCYRFNYSLSSIGAVDKKEAIRQALKSGYDCIGYRRGNWYVGPYSELTARGKTNCGPRNEECPDFMQRIIPDKEVPDYNRCPKDWNQVGNSCEYSRDRDSYSGLSRDIQNKMFDLNNSVSRLFDVNIKISNKNYRGDSEKKSLEDDSKRISRDIARKQKELNDLTRRQNSLHHCSSTMNNFYSKGNKQGLINGCGLTPETKMIPDPYNRRCEQNNCDKFKVRELQGRDRQINWSENQFRSSGGSCYTWWSHDRFDVYRIDSEVARYLNNCNALIDTVEKYNLNLPRARNAAAEISSDGNNNAARMNDYDKLHQNMQEHIHNLSKEYNYKTNVYNKQSDINKRTFDLMGFKTRKVQKQLNELDSIENTVSTRSRVIEENRRHFHNKETIINILKGFFGFGLLVIIPYYLYAAKKIDIIKFYIGTFVIFVLYCIWAIYYYNKRSINKFVSDETAKASAYGRALSKEVMRYGNKKVGEWNKYISESCDCPDELKLDAEVHKAAHKEITDGGQTTVFNNDGYYYQDGSAPNEQLLPKVTDDRFQIKWSDWQKKRRLPWQKSDPKNWKPGTILPGKTWPGTGLPRTSSRDPVVDAKDVLNKCLSSGRLDRTQYGRELYQQLIGQPISAGLLNEIKRANSAKDILYIVMKSPEYVSKHGEKPLPASTDNLDEVTFTTRL